MKTTSTLTLLALALAALTYDTLWPMIGVCLVLFLVEIRKQEIPLREKVKNFTGLFAPAALTFGHLAWLASMTW